MAISPYLRTLRDRIGTDLVLMPSVTALVEDDDGRILLIRDADYGRWNTIGGAIEPDEHPGAAAVRETKEETGLDIELVSIVAAIGGPACRVVYPNGDRVAYTAVVYRARVVGGDPEPDGEEVSELGWFEPEEIPDLDLSDLCRYVFDYVGPTWPQVTQELR